VWLVRRPRPEQCWRKRDLSNAPSTMATPAVAVEETLGDETGPSAYEHRHRGVEFAHLPHGRGLAEAARARDACKIDTRAGVGRCIPFRHNARCR